MENKMIKVVLVEPQKKAVVAEIGSTLEDMKEVVGGLIQILYPFDEDVAIVCSEEGKILPLPANRGLYIDGWDEISDIICGTFFIAGCDEDRLVSLSDEQIMRYKQKFLFPEKFIVSNDTVKAIRYDYF